jgi:uncharacterized protein YjiS (DUF1127 family)
MSLIFTLSRDDLRQIHAASYARAVPQDPATPANTQPAAATRTGLLARVLHRWATARRRRRTLRELSALDDRLLHDLGLTRDRLPDVAQTMALQAAGASQASGGRAERPARLVSTSTVGRAPATLAAAPANTDRVRRSA